MLCRRKYRLYSINIVCPSSCSCSCVTVSAKNSISFIQVGDTVLTDPTLIEVHVLNYFQAIFSVDNNCIQNDLVAATIPSLVSNDDNNILLRLP